MTFFLILAIAMLLPIFSLLFAALMDNASLNDGIPSISYTLEHILSFGELEKRLFNILGDASIVKLVILSILLSLTSAAIVTFLSFVSGFYVTRKKGFVVNFAIPVSILTYMAPPVVLVLALSLIWSDHSSEFVWFKILFSHCIYLFPLAFVLSVGFWLQKTYDIDRVAACDGGNFWGRLKIHIGIQEFLRMCVILMLLFMISWSDIIFSRVLASGDPDKRLVVDYIFQRLFSNAEIEALGDLAFFSLLVVMVSLVISVLFSVAFSRGVIENN